MTPYSTNPTTFEALIAPFPGDIQEIAGQLRQLVREALPDAEENIYGGAKVANALYSLGGSANVICGIQPAPELCRLYVHHIHGLSHPELKIEGKGKHARHVKVRSLAEVKPDTLGWLLKQARDNMAHKP